MQAICSHKYFKFFFNFYLYWNEPQIITKIVCDGDYSMSINIYIFLCTDYFQALIWKEEMFGLASKYHKMSI